MMAKCVYCGRERKEDHQKLIRCPDPECEGHRLLSMVIEQGDEEMILVKLSEWNELCANIKEIKKYLIEMRQRLTE
jgi:hypothetical protein